MKKYITVAALLAAGTAFANAADNTVVTPTVYDAYILHLSNTSNKITELNSTRGQLWFNTDAASLDSWMLEFTLTKLSGGNKMIFATDKGTNDSTEERNGLGVYSWYDNTGLTLGKDRNHFGGTEKLGFPTGTTNSSMNVTYRLAYDAMNDMAYLFCVNTNQITSTLTDEDYVLNGATVGDPADGNGIATFWTDGGVNTLTVATVTDLSGLAGNDKVFEHYVRTTTVIPEPSAFGLLAGLGALALVASRRRRR